MKIIIGVYQKELSHRMSILFSGRKFIAVEANCADEIYSLFQLYPDALLLTEEISPEFYDMLDMMGFNPDIYLLFNSQNTSADLMKLKNVGIKAVIPYVEDPDYIVNAVAENLSLSSSLIKKQDKSVVLDSQEGALVAVYLGEVKEWIYTELLGFNSSKISIKVTEAKLREILLLSKESDHLRLFVQGFYINIYADLVFNKDDIFVFRYRMINEEDQKRLSYYISYCQKQSSLHQDIGSEL